MLSESQDAATFVQLGLRQNKLRLRLYTSGSASSPESLDTGDPFVVLAEGALPFRMYLASLVCDEVVLKPFMAIAMQPNDYPESGQVPQPESATNRQMERVWQEAFRSIQADLTEGVALLEGWTLPQMASASDPPRQGPTTYCRRTDEYIEPLCGACLGKLSVCRDDDFLQSHGLPSWSRSLDRYLYCRACAERPGGRPTVYTYSVENLKSSTMEVRVRRRSELYRDLAPQIQAKADDPDVEHHCFHCEHRNECYPEKRNIDDRVPAEDLLFPLAYYEFCYLPVPALPLEFAEVAALLGGATAHQLCAAADSRNPLRESVLESLVPGRAQFFFEAEPKRFALEALHLKLTAMLGLAIGVRDLHLRARRPHLAISPRRIRGTVAQVSMAPARWGLALKLGDLLTTARLPIGPEDVAEESDVWSIGYPSLEDSLPESMSHVQRETLWMRLRVRRFDVQHVEQNWIGRLEAELEPLTALYRELEHGRFDRVRVLVLEPLHGIPKLTFTGSKAGAIPGGFVFVGSTPTLSPDTAAALGQPLPASWDAEVTILHTYLAPADVFSLGLLLLRLLLVNDQQSECKLSNEVVKRVVSRLTPISGRVEVSPGCSPIEALRQEGIDADPKMVLHRASDRGLSGASNWTDPWQEALLLALKMASNVPGWSLCGRLDDCDAATPGAAMDTVIDELQRLTRWSQSLLIGSHAWSWIVNGVCADFLEDLREALGDDGHSDRVVHEPEPSSAPDLKPRIQGNAK